MTGPPGRGRSLREIAVSFGEDAERYDRTRPGYPAELAEVVLAGMGRVGAGRARGGPVGAGPAGIGPGPGRPLPMPSPAGAGSSPPEVLPRQERPAVLDVGIGTGAAAALFRDAGCRITGVEPDGRMAAVARAAGFAVEDGPFDDWDPAGRGYDVVVSGQAWHWVKQRAGAVKAATALRPGGRLAVFWNVCVPEPEVAAALADVYRDVDMGLDFVPWERSPLGGYEKLAGAAVTGIWGSRAFGPVTRRDIPWQVEFTRDAWVDQVPTLAWHERLSPDALERVLEGNARVVDALGGRVTMPYTTLTLLADRRPA
ncbi:class I SAM-dependent methyltransferase [Myceligenerans pegani]|uniref:Class I SAM-dependent methyltransferase n=1 Tax=Myceligenerans pegani TaxID=2776917 RepID=A0ABR9N5C0_9MICO|nr:class I SAM-dependent methyltransferase [Myceligenerans sp. TRM 65318]MBE1878867.1 class I SAM-dependent methyltransferase [Myceligenerans sp. TRM 65318]MBE3021138.1 class I SAM-dependent methyltransferase [Myceligenerans sp. TRM 65318]